MKKIYCVVLLLLVLLKLDIVFAEQISGAWWAPKNETTQVQQLTEAIVKPWNFKILEGAIAPTLKRKMQTDGMNVFFSAMSRKLGYVREVRDVRYVPESLVSHLLHRGRLYRAEIECMQETVTLEMRVRAQKSQIRIYEFALEANSLDTLYEAAVKAFQGGSFDTKIFMQSMHA